MGPGAISGERGEWDLVLPFYSLKNSETVCHCHKQETSACTLRPHVYLTEPDMTALTKSHQVHPSDDDFSSQNLSESPSLLIITLVMGTVLPGVGPFHYGQTTWGNGPSAPMAEISAQPY